MVAVELIDENQLLEGECNFLVIASYCFPVAGVCQAVLKSQQTKWESCLGYANNLPLRPRDSPFFCSLLTGAATDRAVRKPLRKKKNSLVWSQFRKACDRCTEKKVRDIDY